jgi:hypothetical protein
MFLTATQFFSEFPFILVIDRNLKIVPAAHAFANMKWQRGDQYTKRDRKVGGEASGKAKSAETCIEDGARALVAGLEWHQGL